MVFNEPLKELTASHDTCACRAIVFGEASFDWSMILVDEDGAEFESSVMGRPTVDELMLAVADSLRLVDVEPDVELWINYSVQAWDGDTMTHLAQIVTAQ